MAKWLRNGTSLGRRVAIVNPFAAVHRTRVSPGKTKTMKKLMLNCPAVAAVMIFIAFSADLPFLRPLKTESTFGLWVAVLVPGAILLLILQVIVWLVVPASRLLRSG